MKDKITKALGKISQYNPLTTQPGALVVAKNCFIRRENVIEDRRGHKQYATFASQPANTLVYSNRVLIQRGSSLDYDNGSGTFASYSGTYSAPTNSRVRGVDAFSNLYATTSGGIKVFTDVAGTAAKLAGAPRPLGTTATLSGSSGFLTNAYQCAYRSVIQRTDANGNVVSSYPSQRTVVFNTEAGSRDVAHTEYLPSEVAAGDVIQYYRTAQVSGTSSDTSGDEMALIYQYTITSTDISNKYVTFTDSIVDALRGASLYTSPSQEGIQAANERPPVSKDIALYKSQYMLYANTQTKQRLNFTLVGVSGLGQSGTGDLASASTSVANVTVAGNVSIGWKAVGTGIPANTTVTSVSGSTVIISNAASITTTSHAVAFYTNQSLILANTTYSFGSTEISSGAGSPQVKVFTSGTAAVDIDDTARSLVGVINRYASNTSVYAYYLSGPDDLPGQMLIEERSLGGAAFTVQGSASALTAMFFPAPPVSPDTNTISTSSNSVQKNAVYWSKANQPEHVPILNYLPVGPGNKEILRVVALKESAIIIKEEGIYRWTGETPQSFSAVPIDLTVFCKAKESVAVLANQVYMLSNQGVVAISENGVQVISRDIEPDLMPLLTNTSLANYTVGFAYDSERSYFLSTISEVSDTEANVTWVYNYATRTWVQHTFGIVAGVVDQQKDKAFFVKPDDTNLYIERKDFADTDFADPDLTIAITAVSGDEVDFTSSTAPQVGWVISQSSTEIGIVSFLTISGGYRATMASTPPAAWAAGAAIMYPSVGMEIEYHSWTGNAPEAIKQVRSVAVLSDDTPDANSVSSLVTTFRTNFDSEVEEVTMDAPRFGWGQLWGSSPWGGGGDTGGYPTYVPRNKQYCTRINVGVKHKVAREKLAIAGIALYFEGGAEGVGR